MNRRIGLWFACGFVATFCLLAMLLTKYTMLPSAKGVVAMKLWRYYLNEWPREFYSQAMGPASANGGGLFSTTLQHLALSALGGAVVVSVAWWLQRRSIKRGGPVPTRSIDEP
jgi:hypothetical protein